MIGAYIEHRWVVDHRNAPIDFFDVVKVAVAVLHVVAKDMVAIDVVFAPFETMYYIDIFVVERVIKGSRKQQAFAFSKVNLIGQAVVLEGFLNNALGVGFTRYKHVEIAKSKFGIFIHHGPLGISRASSQ